jgi:hypothetical protein
LMFEQTMQGLGKPTKVIDICRWWTNVPDHNNHAGHSLSITYLLFWATGTLQIVIFYCIPNFKCVDCGEGWASTTQWCTLDITHWDLLSLNFFHGLMWYEFVANWGLQHAILPPQWHDFRVFVDSHAT